MSSVFQLRHGVNAVKICGLLDIQVEECLQYVMKSFLVTESRFQQKDTKQEQKKK